MQIDDNFLNYKDFAYKEIQNQTEIDRKKFLERKGKMIFIKNQKNVFQYLILLDLKLKMTLLVADKLWTIRNKTFIKQFINIYNQKFQTGM